MIKLKLDGKTYNVPTFWKDVSTQQYVELKAWDRVDIIKLLSIITGVDYETIYRTKQFDIDAQLAPYLKFLETPLTEKILTSAKTMKVGDITYTIPSDLTECSLGQKIAATNKRNDAIEKNQDVDTVLSDVVAIYMQPIIQQINFDEVAASKFAREVIDKCSIIETYSVGCFFLSNLSKSSNESQRPFPLNKIRSKRLLKCIDLVYLKKSIQSTRLLGETS